MRLQSKGTPDAVNGATTQPTAASHRANTPVRGLPGSGFQCQRKHMLYLSIGNSTRRTRTRLIDKPSRRLAKNRLRHFPTHCLVMCIRSATCELVLPLEHPRMIRARCAKACAVLGRRAQRSNVSRSSWLRIKAGIGRPVPIVIPPPTIDVRC